ncbi:NACHT, LRR and PYD domains-containing protein 3-like isoform X2 [Pimephales promelas]|uniref:NACHT, LRR and PYD domains-containing protein 3-like isoform X2 n=1 Tax=Pimephales promelas TaxID=90988 RepID=UPI00195584CA|nr:NACHT, LRR and PYD domains-containing protein 3-like isoform X2 [Pimephales promelas]
MDDTQTSRDENFSPGCSSVDQKRSEPEPSCVSMRSDGSMNPPMHFKSGDTQTDLSSVDQKRSEPEPSCVSMRSDWSMNLPLQFKSGDTQTDLSSVNQRRSEPEPSCVSMRSDGSMNPPMHFKSGDTQTDLSSVDPKRSEPEPSCVSMRSDGSMNPPMHFKSGDTQTDLRSEPEPSCVSMRSDWSMDPPMQFKSGDTQTDLSSVDHRRSEPETSCVSMSSDWSMDPPMQFKSGDTQTDLSSVDHRRSGPEPSCVSMRSDWSMDPPMQFKSGDTQTDLSSVDHRRSGPETSCVSMRSDWSMDPPMQFKSGDTQTDLSSVDHRRSGPETSCVSMRSDWSMDPPMQFKSGDTQTDLRHEVLTTFRSNLMKKFECFYEGTANQGNPTVLNEIYTELYITESESGDISNEHEVRQIETQSRRAATDDTQIKCNDIFRPLPGQEKPIRTVLTKGVAGIGKTVSVQKFILDWAEEKVNQDVQLIFPLPFREINLIKDKTLSLSGLLHVFFPETKEMEISSVKYKVLFIFDGLDECRLSLDFQSDVRLCDVSESASVDVLLTNLIVGNLLPSALIWITSRPAAADLVPSECVHRVTEVRGFNDPQKEEYFRKRVRDHILADTIITHLKSSRSLYIMCHIPVFCWISATVLEKMMSETERREIPKTLTQMYTHFLILQTNIKHEKDYEKQVTDEDMILKLGKLAFQQLVKGNVIFYEEDLRECGIDVTEASVYSGLCTQIFREEFGWYQGKVFCFVHLSIQEHLAALYAHLSFTNNNTNVFDSITKQSLWSKVKDWFQLMSIHVSLSALHQRAVNEALLSKNGHLDLFLRFLLGLSVESLQILLQKLMKQTIRSDSNEETVKYIKKKIRTIDSPEKYINLFHCLHELGDRSLVEEIQQYLKSGRIKETKLSSSQWSAVVFVLLTSEEKLDKFDINDFVGRENKTEKLKVLQKLLPVIKESRSVQLRDCGVTDEGFAALTSALRSNPEHLRELDLSENKIGESVNLLSDVLQNPHCKLEKLWLRDCGVTDEGFAALTSALISNPEHLRELDLSGNKIGESVNLLSDVLQNPHCKLEKLWLMDCGVTDEGFAALTSALRSNHEHLRVLDLSLNKIGESVNLLSDVLQNPHCKLERLRLRDCGVTDEGFAALTSALRSNPEHLRVLSLSGNKIGESVNLLSDVLQNPHCKLEILGLRDCGVTDEGCAALTSALRSNPKHLRVLNLSGNKIGESGVKLLSDLKDDPHYKLKELVY